MCVYIYIYINFLCLYAFIYIYDNVFKIKFFKKPVIFRFVQKPLSNLNNSKTRKEQLIDGYVKEAQNPKITRA